MSSKMLLLSVASLLAGAFFAMVSLSLFAPVSYIALIIALVAFSASVHYFGVVRGWWKPEIRNSTKSLLISIGLLLPGAMSAFVLSIEFSAFALIMTVVLFFLSGRKYGIAQGWWEIELRQDWRIKREWKDHDFVGLLLGFGLGMKEEEIEKEGWNSPRKKNM